MESHFCHVVVVAFDVVLQRPARRARVPVTVMSFSITCLGFEKYLNTIGLRLLENGSAPCRQQCLCREKRETSMGLYCLMSSSISTVLFVGFLAFTDHRQIAWSSAPVACRIAVPQHRGLPSTDHWGRGPQPASRSRHHAHSSKLRRRFLAGFGDRQGAESRLKRWMQDCR